VAPTEVTHGQEAGNWGGKWVVLVPSLVRQPAPMPESPEEKRTDTPRLPSWAMRLQTVRAYFSGISWGRI
jgi:hypothetical protein